MTRDFDKLAFASIIL